MKKGILVLLTFIPVVFGYVFSYAMMIPRIGSQLFYLYPIGIIIFWFWLGTRYSKTQYNLLFATLLGNAIGLISLTLYFVQFILLDDSRRNLFLAGFSQMFTSSIAPYTARIAVLLEANKNSISQTTFTAIQWIGLIIMVVIFVAGYLVGKLKKQMIKTEV